MAVARETVGPHADVVAAIRMALAGHADPVRATSQQAYMRSAMPFHGIAAADVRRIVRAALDERADALGSRERWEATVRALWDGATHREERYAAIAVARHRIGRGFRAEGALDLYRHLVETGAWWDFVDEVATHLVRDELLGDRPRVAPIVRDWSIDPDLWVRRTAILCQVGAGNRIDLDLLHDVIVPNLEGACTVGPDGRQDFFVRKAIGWALRDAARKHPAEVVAFVDAHRSSMAGLSVREALKRI